MVPGSYASTTARYVSHAGTDSCALGAGDANGLWEPGEDVDFDVTLQATGELTGVAGTLTTSTPGVTITTGSATWPDLAMGVNTVNDAPGFGVTLDGVACLDEIAFTLDVTANEGGPFVQEFTQAVGRRLAPDVPKPILDNGSTTSDLLVGQSFSLNTIAVRVQATHSWVGDLRLSLRAPDGREVLLLDRPQDPGGGGSCNDEDLDVLFDDASLFDASAYCNGDTPWLSGDAFPVEALSLFNGMDVAGTWTLLVEDQVNADDGTINWWELVTDPPLSSDCTECDTVACPGTEISAAALRVSKTPAGEVRLEFTGPDSACATGVQVRLASTPRPAAGAGGFPVDPAFADVSAEDLDAGPTFAHGPPAGAAYYLVVEDLPDGSPGPSGHYGD
jgi:subtilisin-like proprotein convertase family protein